MLNLQQLSAGKLVLLGTIWISVVSAITYSVFLFVTASTERETTDAFRRPLAVVSMKVLIEAKSQAIMAGAGDAPLSPGEMNVQIVSFMDQLVEKLEYLRAKGFIVMNRGQVLAAPADVDFTLELAHQLGLEVSYRPDAPLSDAINVDRLPLKKEDMVARPAVQQPSQQPQE